MEKERGTKLIAVFSLFVAIIGLSVGFAAFSNSLNIQPSASVTPDAKDFNVDFSSSNASQTIAKIVPVVVGGAQGEEATINNDADPVLSGAKVTFTAPGQSALYTFYVHNVGQYKAFLNEVKFNNASNGKEFKVCTAGAQTNDGYTQEACKGIKVTLTVGSDNYTQTTSAIKDKTLGLDEYAQVQLKIEYEADAARADGDFSVAFGDITLLYTSVNS